MLRCLIQVLVAVALVFGILQVARNVEKTRGDFDVEESIYISKYKEIRSFALGFEGEYADFLWIASLQAFHKHIFQQVHFQRISDVYDVITDLDPYFQEPYNTGSIYIAITTKSSLEGIKILEKGTQKIPKEPWIWELLGRMYWLERFFLQKKDEMSLKESTERAIKAIAVSVELDPSSEDRKILLQRLGEQDRFSTFDTLTWLRIYSQSSKNKPMKAIALRRLQLHIIQTHLRVIKDEIDSFFKKHGRLPVNLAELGIVLPQEPQDRDMPEIADALSLIVQETIKNRLDSEINDGVLYNQTILSKGIPYIYDKRPLERHLSSVVNDMNKSMFCKHAVFSQEKVPDYLFSRIVENMNAISAAQMVQRIIYRFYTSKGRLPVNLDELIQLNYFKRSLPFIAPWKEYQYNPADGTVTAVDKK